MLQTPEEPYNRQHDPQYVDMILGTLKQKMNEVIDEGSSPERQLLELDVLRFAAQAVINPHDTAAVDELGLARFKLNYYDSTHPGRLPEQNDREDG